MKTARFSEVVAHAGRPALHLAWTVASTDAGLKRAAAEHRVMTIQQRLRGGKKDFGEVGLVNLPNTQHLVFPRSLRSFAGRRIVGIDYNLLAEAEVAGKIADRAAPASRNPVRAKGSDSKVRATTEKADAPPAKAKPARVEPSPAAPLSREEIRREIQAAIRDLRRRRTGGALQRLVAVLPRLEGASASET